MAEYIKREDAIKSFLDADTDICPSCDWEGKIEMHPDDIKALDEIFREHMKKNKKPAHEPK